MCGYVCNPFWKPPSTSTHFRGDGISKAREAAEGAEGAEGEDSSDGRCVGCLVVNNGTHKAQKDGAVFVSYCVIFKVTRSKFEVL